MIILSEKQYARLIVSNSRLLSVENLIDMLDEQNYKEYGTYISRGGNCINYDPKDLIIKIKKLVRHPSGKYAVWLAEKDVKDRCSILTFLKSFTALNINSNY
jgi:hypothetical protein